MSETMYAVTGATGQLGRLIISDLLEKVSANQVVAVVRDAQKANDLEALGVTVRVATYQDVEALQAALTGVTKLMLVSSSDLTSSRFEQHRNVIDAAKAVGVESVAYTSILRADTTTNPLAPDHKATEEYLASSGLSYAFLRHGWYTENYIDTVKTAEQSGSVLTSAQDGKVSSASRADYAAADVAVLLGDITNNTYELAGDTAWTFSELAQAISAIIGKDVAVQNVSTDEHIKMLESFGLDNGTAQFVAAIDAAIAEGMLEDTSSTLSSLIGRPTTSLEEGLRAAYVA